MITQEPILEEISYDTYQLLLSKMGESEKIFNNKICKKLKIDELVPTGEGIIKYIERYYDVVNSPHTPEDYRYYKIKGYTTVMIITPTMHKALNDVINHKFKK